LKELQKQVAVSKNGIMNTIIFVLTLSAETLTTLAVMGSIVWPGHRIWPPCQQHAWGQYAMLTLFVAAGMGVILLGILDWKSLGIPLWIRVLFGTPLWLGGGALSLWAVAALGVASTLGVESAIIRRGPYRFSRNPQYVGFILSLAGWALVTSSLLALIASLFGIIPLILVPFTEEPWLLERYGATYAEYMQSVPRFIVLKK